MKLDIFVLRGTADRRDINMHFLGNLLHGNRAKHTAVTKVILLSLCKFADKPKEGIAAGVNSADKRLRFGEFLLEVLCDLRLCRPLKHSRIFFIDGDAGEDSPFVPASAKTECLKPPRCPPQP